MAQRIFNNQRKNEGKLDALCCEHRNTISVTGLFHFMTRCAMCQSRIWDILNVDQCIDCDCIMHGSCSFSNRLCLIAQDPKTLAEVEKDHGNETLGNTKESRLTGRFARARDALVKSLERKSLDSMEPEARRAVEREIRARKAIERRDVAVKNEKTRTRRSEDENAMTNGYSRSWRDRPAPEVDYFVVSKWVRETFCNGQPTVAPTTTNRKPVGNRKNAMYRAWMAPQTTLILDNSTPLEDLPSPPSQGQYWYGRQSYGPFKGPLMWNPVHAGPRSFENPAFNTVSTTENPAAEPFSFDVPGYLDEKWQPALFKVTVTP